MNPNIEILESICRQSDAYSKSSEWHEAEKFFSESLARLASFENESSYSELREKFDASHKLFLARLEAHTSRKMKIARREELCSEIEKLVGNPAPEAVDKVELLSKEWYQMEFVSPEYMEILQTRFDKAVKEYFRRKDEIDTELMKLRAKKSELDAICERAESLAAGKTFTKKESREISELAAKLDATLQGLKDFDSHTERFRRAADDFEKKKEETRSKLASEAEAEQNLLEGLCEELRKCLVAEDLRTVLPKVREIRGLFKPGDTKFSGKKKLVETIGELVNEFYSKLKTKFEEEDWARWEHYTYKVGLCERAEKLIQESDFYRKSKELVALRKEWKDVGAVPREKAEEVWNRFNTVCEKIYSECQEHFARLEEERNGNYAKKLPLCEEIEKLSASEEWEDSAEKIRNLRTQFQSIGAAPRDKENELRERIRKACDFFFGKRKEHYSEMHHRQSEARRAKNELCEQAEKLKEMPRPDAIRTARELRGKWKEIGTASYRDERRIWDRFNGAIESFFKGLDDERTRNTEARRALCEEASTAVAAARERTPGEIERTVAELKDKWGRLGYGIRDQEESLADNFFARVSDLQKIWRDRLRESQSQMEGNIEAKISMIDRIEAAPADQMASPEALEAEWAAAGEIPPDRRESLENHFRRLLETVRNGNSGEISEIRRKRPQILDKRRKLCVELEKVTGFSAQEPGKNAPSEASSGEVSLDMLNELKFALETNVTLGRRKTDFREALDRVKDLEAQWKSLESLPCREELELTRRFNDTLSKFRKEKGRRA